MTNAAILTEMLKADEGLRLDVYADSDGNPTVGYGHEVLPADALSLDDTITQAQADAFLHADAAIITGQLSRLDWFNSLDDVRQTAIADMAYNLGLPRLLEFGKMISCLRIGSYQAAANEMLNSLWARQVSERAIRLAKIIQTGSYP